MKVTGKELWGMQADAMDEANARYLREGHGSLSEMFWDAMAAKLNGMNGEPIDACPLCHRQYEGRRDWEDKIVGTFMKCEDIDRRARHHSTCPYRHGKGDCNCGPD